MNRFYKISFTAIILTIGLSAGTVSAQVGIDNPTGTAGQFNGNVTTGSSYDPYTANATRSITDLVVAGGVGSYPLAFTRTMNSRHVTGMPAPFGLAGNWNHSFGWSINPIPVSGTGKPAGYTVNYPDGRQVIFSRQDAVSSVFRGPLGVRDRFQKIGTITNSKGDCYLILPDGGKVHF